MGYQVGDTVIHGSYGLGEVVGIEEKEIRNRRTKCYVVRTADLTIWVPTDMEQHSLRTPTSPQDFSKLFDILSSPGEALLEDRMLRKEQLMTQIRDGQLGSICRVIRDLTHYKLTTRLNDGEKSILERTTNSLLTEWTFCLGIPLHLAQKSLTNLLDK